MKLLIIAIGSQGDVAPFTGLGVALRDAGHEVTVATHPMHENMILDAGLAFRLVPGDPRDLSTTDDGQEWQSNGKGARGLFKFLKILQDQVRMYNEGIEKAALQGADMLLLSGTAVNGYHVAEAMGIPSMCVTLVPLLPAADFPPPLMFPKSLGRLGNKSTSWAMSVVTSRMLGGPTNELRERLGLPPVTVRGLLRRWDTERWPVSHGISPEVLPRSREWREGMEMTGYWWPERPAGWEPDSELLDFLQAGPPPVFVGFGSNLSGDAERISETVSAALNKAGVRGIVQAGWAGLAATNDDILSIKNVPYDWLFPRMAGAVHHGGAGTSAAALRAKIPSVPVPAIVDQAFWAERLRKLGASPGPLPMGKLNTESLTASIRSMLDRPQYRARAVELGTRIDAEDGAGHVVRTVEGIFDRHPATR